MNLPLLVVTLALLLLSCLNAFSPTPCYTRHSTCTRDDGTPTARQHMVSGGFSFSDGEQVLVSVQKPLGLVLEQDENGPILVTEVGPTGSAGRAGVQAGDVLVAVQNASVETADLNKVLGLIGQLPRVVNLRFVRV
jgi:S1-C subfamily serine protease